MNKEEGKVKGTHAKRVMYGVIIALAITSFTFNILDRYKLEQTSLLFVGIPALLSILIIKYSGKSRNPYLIVLKVITLFLLIAFMFLGEGMVCIIMMAPLFYLIGFICAFIYKLFRKSNKSKLNSFILLPVLFIIGQGYEVGKDPQVNRIETTVLVNGKKHLEDLNKNPNFLEDLPAFLTIGFPKPVANSGYGLQVGDIRNITFNSTTKGDGALILKIKSIHENKVLFETQTDHTHINHWLTWKEVEVSLKHNKDQTTAITWTTHYTCDLGPSWYFKTIENYAVDLMNRHLIQSYFNTPTHVD